MKRKELIVDRQIKVVSPISTLPPVNESSAALYSQGALSKEEMEKIVAADSQYHASMLLKSPNGEAYGSW